MCAGRLSMASGNGKPAMIGIVAPRSRLPSPLQRARKRPPDSTNTVSCPPTVATGTIGTPDRMACRTNPLRPASTARSRMRQLRMASCSPPRPDDHVVAGGQGGGDTVSRGGDDAGGLEVVAQSGRGHQYVVRGAVQNPFAAETPLPRVHKRPGVNGQRSAGMDTDKQRRLIRQALPAVDLEAKVMVGQEVPHRPLKQPRESGVRPVGGCRRSYATGDEARQ